jgi:hypothetical protein
VEPETLIETVRSLRIEVQSYKEDNEKMMKEHNQINSQMMQILNQLQRASKEWIRFKTGGRRKTT